MVKKIFGQIYIWLILIIMYLPILILMAFSFTDAVYVGQWNGFTFDLYPRLFQNQEIMIALGNTLIIALVSALVSTLLGTTGAIGAFYSKKWFRKTIDSLTQIPIVNAEIVMALSLTILFVFMGQYIFHTQLFSFWTLLIGHVVLSLPFVYICMNRLRPWIYRISFWCRGISAWAVSRPSISTIAIRTIRSANRRMTYRTHFHTRTDGISTMPIRTSRHFIRIVFPAW